MTKKIAIAVGVLALASFGFAKDRGRTVVVFDERGGVSVERHASIDYATQETSTGAIGYDDDYDSDNDEYAPDTYRAAPAPSYHVAPPTVDYQKAFEASLIPSASRTVRDWFDVQDGQTVHYREMVDSSRGYRIQWRFVGGYPIVDSVSYF